MKVEDIMTWVGNPEDLIYLNSQLFPVNMRLLKTSGCYRDIIKCICDKMRFLALSNHEGYGRPYGISGANLAVPFNIIGVVHDRGTNRATCEIMLNPQIVAHSKKTIVTLSNCGSIRLSKLLPVRRYIWVEVEWFDEQGRPQKNVFSRYVGGYTVQHEVDHNNGILITERKAVGE